VVYLRDVIIKVTALTAIGLLGIALLPLLMIPGAGGADVATHSACGPIGVILDTIRTVESGGNYQTRVSSSTASGAYGFLDSSWRHYAAAAGVDTSRYPSAWMAPAAEQDATATVYVNEIITDHAGDVSMIPLSWYLPSAINNPAKMDVVPPMGANVLTPRQYQTKWLAIYQQKLAESGSAPPDPTGDQATTSVPPKDPAGGCPTTDSSNTVSVDGQWALPSTREVLARAGITSPHHDYPAVDLMMAEGAPIYAITNGTVVRTTHFNADWWRSGCPRPGCATCGLGITIQHPDGLRHTYCHNRALHVTQGQQVTPGQHIADSGDTGRSGAPHLHLELRINNVRRCPQPLLDALYNRRPVPAAAGLPTGGCF